MEGFLYANPRDKNCQRSVVFDFVALKNHLSSSELRLPTLLFSLSLVYF